VAEVAGPGVPTGMSTSKARLTFAWPVFLGRRPHRMRPLWSNQSYASAGLHGALGCWAPLAQRKREGPRPSFRFSHKFRSSAQNLWSMVFTFSGGTLRSSAAQGNGHVSQSVKRRPTDPRPGLLQAAGSDLTSVIGRGLRSPSLSTCRPSATARSAAATILTRSAFVGVSASGPSSTFGRPPFAGRPRN
jgi:hypothetical protein